MLVEAITLLLWLLLALFALFCLAVFGVVAINVFCVILYALSKVRRKFVHTKLLHIMFAPAMWAMEKMEEADE